MGIREEKTLREISSLVADNNRLKDEFAFILPGSVVAKMILFQALAKTLYEIIMYPVTRKVIMKLRKM